MSFVSNLFITHFHKMGKPPLYTLKIKAYESLLFHDVDYLWRDVFNIYPSTFSISFGHLIFFTILSPPSVSYLFILFFFSFLILSITPRYFYPLKYGGRRSCAAGLLVLHSGSPVPLRRTHPGHLLLLPRP